MDIDKEQLIKETARLGNSIYNGLSLDRVAREYSCFMAMNSIIGNLAGGCLDYNVVFKNQPEMPRYIKKDYDKSMMNFYSKVLKEFHLYKQICTNTLTSYLDSDIEDYMLGGKFRHYSEKDAKEILLNYFSQYGEKAYQVAKRMIDENRIQMGYQYKNSPSMAFHTGSVLLQSGYICLHQDKYDTATLSFLAHEIGHAIDKELFYYPQQKKIKIYDDPFNEVPSTFFELGMLSYLKEEGIDPNGALVLESFYMNIMYGRQYHILETLTEMEKTGRIEITEEFREWILYGIGYYISLALNEESRKNPREYFKYFTDMICSRNECNFEQLIEVAGLDTETFFNGDFIKKRINDEKMQLKKRYGYKE